MKADDEEAFNHRGEDKMKCHKCGFQLNNDEHFCPSCGSHIRISDWSRYTEDDAGFAIKDAKYIKPMVQLKEDWSDKLNNNGQAGDDEDWWQKKVTESNPDGDDKSSDRENTPKAGRRKAVRDFLMARPYLGFVALLLIGILLYNYFSSDKSAYVLYKKNSNALQVYSADRKTRVLNRKGEIVHSFDRTGIPQYCRDKSAAVIYLTGAGEQSDPEVYYVTEKDSIRLDNDMIAYAMSADGRYLFYSRELSNRKFGLLRYDRKAKKERILLEIEEKKFGLIKASPDGKTLAYSLIPINNDKIEISKLETFILREGKEAEYLGDNLHVIEVSDDGKYIYYLDYDNIPTSLNVRHKGKVIKLTDSLRMTGLWINQDYSEMLFSVDKSTYLYDGGDKVLKIAETEAVELILPYQYEADIDLYNSIVFCNVKSFKKKIIRCSDYTIRIINKYGEAEEICRIEPESRIALSSDGNSLLYSTSEGSIQKVSDITGKCKESTVVAQMNSFITTADLSQIYYLIGNELYYKEGGKEAVKLADGITSLMNNGDYTGALLLSRTEGRGELYYSRKGSKPEQLLKNSVVIEMKRLESGYAVEIVTIKPTGAFEYYYNSEGKKMRLLEEKIS